MQRTGKCSKIKNEQIVAGISAGVAADLVCNDNPYKGEKTDERGGNKTVCA